MIRISELTAIGSLELTDILEVVDDPGGSPLSRKATFQQVADVVSADADIADAISKKHSQNTDTGTMQTSFSIDSGGSIVKKAATKTSDTLSKTIGSGGDYATHALAMAAVPDLLAHAVTHVIKAGTTLTEICNIYNKHATTAAGSYTLQGEKYYPTSGTTLPTADSATSTTLVDAALASEAFGDDYFNGCWVFIVHGTGTDNGFVAITDYTDSTGTITVASWPGTQPDATSRYIIVGALIDGESSRLYGMATSNCTAAVALKGIGVTGPTAYAIFTNYCINVSLYTCGAYGVPRSGLHGLKNIYTYSARSGFVACNSDSGGYGGVVINGGQGFLAYNAFSDNNQVGLRVQDGAYVYAANQIGDGNGTWGTYAENGGAAYCPGTECSGSSGDHSNGSGDGSIAY